MQTAHENAGKIVQRGPKNWPRTSALEIVMAEFKRQENRLIELTRRLNEGQERSNKLSEESHVLQEAIPKLRQEVR